MLPALNRLTKDDDFKMVAQKGVPSFSRLFTIKKVRNGLEYSRIGVVVSTKADKRATARNQIRRKVREVIRLHLAEIQKGYDIMIVTKSAAVKMSYVDVEKDILDLLSKAKITHV